MGRDPPAVADLNEAAGKSSPGKRKRTVAVEDLVFSPQKKQRTRNGPHEKASKSAAPPTGRRSVYSPDAEDDAGEVPKALPRKVRSLKAKKADFDRNSPLKKMGHNPADIQIPGRVNLTESPSKNTRSRTAIVLPPKIPPLLSSKSAKNQKRSTRLSVSRGEIAAPAEVWENSPRSARRQTRSDEDSPHHSSDSVDMQDEVDSEEFETRDAGAETDSTTGAKSSQVSETEQIEPTVRQSTQSKARSKQKPKQNLGTRPAPVREESAENSDGTVQDGSDLNQEGTAKDLQQEDEEHEMGAENNDMVQIGPDATGDEKEEAKYRRCGKQFVKEFQRATSWHHCTLDWHMLGGAVLRTRNKFRDVEPESARCKALKRRFTELMKICQEYPENSADARLVDASMKTTISRTHALCAELKTTEKRKDRSQIILDLYRHTIPHSVRALRAYLRTHGQSDDPFEGSRLEQFIQLLQIAADLCGQASNWMPRPSTLEVGLAQRMRRRIRPPLQRIQDRFQMQLKTYERRTRTDVELSELEVAQQARLEALRQKREQLYVRPKFPLSLPSRNGLHSRLMGWDIGEAGPPIGSGNQHRHARSNSAARPGLERQTTEEIVPPPMDWTEDEKISLLNALEQHQGEDRYWQISKAYNELQDRSIDELRAAALYFKELVLSAPEFDGNARSDFPYLLSVE